MEPVTGIIIKPVSNGCNLCCDYCYAGARGPGGVRHMPVETAKQIIRSVLEQEGVDRVEFIWHGGEPLLRGKAFFEEIFSYQKALAAERPHPRFANAIQTNITLLNDEWIQFFSSHGIQLSTSLDGPPWIHDSHRRTPGGAGSYEAVVARAREPPHWEAYPQHQFISTVGALTCCANGGCWKSRCQKVGDGDQKDIANDAWVCVPPIVGHIPLTEGGRHGRFSVSTRSGFVVLDSSSDACARRQGDDGYPCKPASSWSNRGHVETFTRLANVENIWGPISWF